MKKQLVFVSYNYWPPDFGGELSLSIERFNALSEANFDVTVLTSGRSGFPSRHMDRNMTVYRSPLVGLHRIDRLLRRLVFVLWTVWHLLRLPMNVLHIGDLPGIGPATSAMAVWLWAALARMRRAYSVSVHSLADSPTALLQTQGWQGWWRSSQLRAVDKVVSLSPALHQAVETVIPGKSQLIVNGIVDDFQPIPASRRQFIRQQAGVLHDDDVVFTFLGSVGARKGLDTLADAFAELAPSHTHWHLWVIGPRTPAESQNINPDEVKSVTAGLTDFATQVTFWGRVDDRLWLRDLLAASDVFVFPTRREGLGVAPMEAMATGLPVIISRIPGITDLVNIDGETGFYMAPGDTLALKEFMLRLGDAPDLRRSMGAAARQRILDSFGWTAYLKKWEALYRQENVQ